MEYFRGGQSAAVSTASRTMGLRVGVMTMNREPSSGGGWTFCSALIEALRTVESAHTFIALDGVSAGRRLRPVADLPPEQPPKQLSVSAGLAHARELIRHGLRGAFGRVRRKGSKERRHRRANRLEALVARGRIDLVWLMEPGCEPLSVPYIATVWDLEHRQQPYFPEVSATGWTWSARETYYEALLPRASLIITGTAEGKRQIVHYFRVNPANVMVNPFPAPGVALMAGAAKGSEIREKYGLNGEFLLYPAQFWPHKNHVNLLKALRLLGDRGEGDLKLVMTGGDMGNLAYVRSQAAEFGLSDRVFFLGFVPREDLNDLYRTSTALVFPSYFGPDNFPPLEAFALGVPVVAANVPGAEEQIGTAALLFDPSDPSDIAAKVQEVRRNAELRAEMIRKGGEIAKRRTPEAYVLALCSFLDRFEAVRRCWSSPYQYR